jgi:hypothetical protein
VYVRSIRGSCNCKSEISMLKSIIECKLGLVEVVSVVALRILKSPIRIHDTSCMHEIIRISYKNSFL